MAIPVIPLQDNIREGEGYGSAFILPREQRASAVDILAADYRRRKQEQAVADKNFADELAALDSLGKGLLPQDEKVIRDLYSNHLNWIGQQGRSGLTNPANPASGSYLENKRRMNELTSVANIGKYRKELLKDLQEKALTGDYDEDSLRQVREYITTSPINEFDPNKVGQIQKRFNIDSYEDSLLKGVKLPQTTTFENVKTEGGKKVGTKVTRYDTTNAVETLVNDNSYDGKRAQKFYLDQYNGLNDAEKKKIIDRVVKKNASANNNVDVLRSGIIKEVARDRANRRYGATSEYAQYDIDQPKSSGSVASFDDDYTVTSTASPSVEDKRFTSTAVIPGKNNTRTVTVKRKGGKHQEKFELIINGKPVTPVNYVVDDETGEVVFNFLGYKPATKLIKKDGVMVETEIRNSNDMPVYEQKPQSIVLNDATYNDIAAELGFSGENGVANFKSKVLGIKGKKKTESAPASKWNKYKR